MGGKQPILAIFWKSSRKCHFFVIHALNSPKSSSFLGRKPPLLWFFLPLFRFFWKTGKCRKTTHFAGFLKKPRYLVENYPFLRILRKTRKLGGFPPLFPELATPWHLENTNHYKNERLQISQSPYLEWFNHSNHSNHSIWKFRKLNHSKVVFLESKHVFLCEISLFCQINDSTKHF